MQNTNLETMMLKRGRGRPRSDGQPKISDRYVPQFHSSALNTQAINTGNTSVPRTIPDLRKVRFDSVVGSDDFRCIVEQWDSNSSAYSIANKYNITPQCARRWAQMVDPFYAQKAQGKPPHLQQNRNDTQTTQDIAQAAHVPDDAPASGDDFDDPFGLGISLGWSAGEDKVDDGAVRNPFSFSRVKGHGRNPFPYSAQPNVRRPLHLKGDVLLLPDIHVPFWSADRLWAGVRTAKAYGCDQVVLLGDQLDLPQISGFPGPPPSTTISEDLEMLGKIIKVMQNLGFKVHAILGNHSARLMRATGGQLNMDWLLKNVYEGVLVSEQHEFCTAEVGGRKWVLAHGSGSNPLTFGQKTCAAAGGASVAFGHFHRMSVNVDVSGQHQILGAGHMLCESMVPYYNFRIHSQKWTPSCGILIREAWGGRGKVLTPDSPDIVGA